MIQTLEQAASSTVQWFRGNAGPSAASALIGVAVARHPALILIPVVALTSWKLAALTAQRSCYKGACVRCGYTVYCALILDGKSEWVTSRLGALGVPCADVPRLLGRPLSDPAARVSHALFVCPWCACLRMGFHPEATRLGGLLPVLRQPHHTGRLASWATRVRCLRRRFTGIIAGRPAGGYIGVVAAPLRTCP